MMNFTKRAVFALKSKPVKVSTVMGFSALSMYKYNLMKLTQYPMLNECAAGKLSVLS